MGVLDELAKGLGQPEGVLEKLAEGLEQAGSRFEKALKHSLDSQGKANQEDLDPLAELLSQKNSLTIPLENPAEWELDEETIAAYQQQLKALEPKIKAQEALKNAESDFIERGVISIAANTEYSRYVNKYVLDNYKKVPVTSSDSFYFQRYVKEIEVERIDALIKREKASGQFPEALGRAITSYYHGLVSEEIATFPEFERELIALCDQAGAKTLKDHLETVHRQLPTMKDTEILLKPEFGVYVNKLFILRALMALIVKGSITYAAKAANK